MTATNEPNEYGFAGDATAPDPAHPEAPAHPEHSEDTGGENFAIPSDDLTGSLSDGIDELTHAGDARDADPR